MCVFTSKELVNTIESPVNGEVTYSVLWIERFYLIKMIRNEGQELSCKTIKQEAETNLQKGTASDVRCTITARKSNISIVQ